MTIGFYQIRLLQELLAQLMEIFIRGWIKNESLLAAYIHTILVERPVRYHEIDASSSGS
jgi:hypothetical protein